MARITRSTLWPISSTFLKSLVCVALASLDILLGPQWYELESKGRAIGLQSLTPGLVSPSLDTSPLLLLELGYNSRLDVVLGFCL